MYWIYLSGHPVKIGHIDYRGYHFSVDCGDVGYFVDDRFSGNDYAYKSLVLLSDFLFKNDIHDFYISVSLNHPASLKIVLKAIKNYGGSVIKVEDDIVTFQCKTRLKTRLKGKA
jgi:RimJ/RimL family protein N-acetyltransferase